MTFRKTKPQLLAVDSRLLYDRRSRGDCRAGDRAARIGGIARRTDARNAADARARSQVAAYTEGLIDQMRAAGYGNIGCHDRAQ